MFFSVEQASRINRRFIGMGNLLVRFYPSLKYDLRSAGIDADTGAYAVAALISALIWGALMYGFSYFALRTRGVDNAGIVSLGPGLFIAVVILLVQFVYPRIIGRTVADKVDRELIFALKDMYIQINSGISLFDAMCNISKSDYGHVSDEFELAVREITAGESEEKALERLAMKTKSDCFKKALWQLITAMRSGSSTAGALRSVIDVLIGYQHRMIKNYASELNFWILMFMLVAATIPTLGITLSVVLSTFGRTGITPLLFVEFVVASFVVQAVMIGFLRSRRPEVYV
ncbi:type II secretion system F family protein [Candidatus Micrarchaeota archaeon]|nr:type II secretion system F family protein [Candidatus Micrarchaeota archaeon]